MDARDLQARLAFGIRVSEGDGGLRVSTQCLFPSNSAVAVTVRGEGSQCVVSDDAAALYEIGGRRNGMTDRQIRALVKRQGLKVQDGAIYSPVVSVEHIAPAILMVANASKEVADWGLEHLRLKSRRNFKQALADLLERHFHDNLKNDAPIVGASNKAHRFSHVIYLPDDFRLLIDPAVNDASSINSRVVANLDVKMVGDMKTRQLIVYDDDLDWSSSDLKLLEVGARTVPFSRAEPEIQRLTA